MNFDSSHLKEPVQLKLWKTGLLGDYWEIMNEMRRFELLHPQLELLLRNWNYLQELNRTTSGGFSWCSGPVPVQDFHQKNSFCWSHRFSWTNQRPGKEPAGSVTKWFPKRCLMKPAVQMISLLGKTVILSEKQRLLHQIPTHVQAKSTSRSSGPGFMTVTEGQNVDGPVNQQLFTLTRLLCFCT